MGGQGGLGFPVTRGLCHAVSMMHQQAATSHYSSAQGGSQHYQGQSSMAMMGQGGQGSTMMGQRPMAPYRPSQQGEARRGPCAQDPCSRVSPPVHEQGRWAC